MAELPPENLIGWVAVPDLAVLGREYRRDLSPTVTKMALSSVSAVMLASGWRIVLDNRAEGVKGLVLAGRKQTDPRDVRRSIALEPYQIRSVYRPGERK